MKVIPHLSSSTEAARAPAISVCKKGVLTTTDGRRLKVSKLSDVLPKTLEVEKIIRSTEVDEGDLTVKKIEADFKKTARRASSGEKDPLVRAKALDSVVQSSPFRLRAARMGTQERNGEKDEKAYYRITSKVKETLGLKGRREREVAQAHSYIAHVDSTHREVFAHLERARLQTTLNDSLSDVCKALIVDSDLQLENNLVRTSSEDSINSVLVRDKVFEEFPEICNLAEQEVREQVEVEVRAEVSKAETKPSEKEIRETIERRVQFSRNDVSRIANRIANEYAEEHGVTLDASDLGKTFVFTSKKDKVELTLAKGPQGEIVPIFRNVIDLKRDPIYQEARNRK